MKTIEYREAAWRIIVAYFAAAVFLVTPYLIGQTGFWLVGGVGGMIALFIAVYSSMIGRVKIRLTDTALEYRTFRVTLPYDSIKAIAEQIPLNRPDSSVKDCLWLRIDAQQTATFGKIARLALEKADGDTFWIPVGIVGQAETKRQLLAELSRRIQMTPNHQMQGTVANRAVP